MRKNVVYELGGGGGGAKRDGNVLKLMKLP